MRMLSVQQTLVLSVLLAKKTTRLIPEVWLLNYHSLEFACFLQHLNRLVNI